MSENTMSHEHQAIENIDGSDDFLSLGKVEYLPAWEEITMETTAVHYNKLIKEIETQLLIERLDNAWKHLRKIANGNENLECTLAARRVLTKRKSRAEEANKITLPDSIIDYTQEIPYKDGQEQEEGRKKMQWSNEELLERGYINEEHYLYCLKYKINC